MPIIEAIADHQKKEKIMLRPIRDCLLLTVPKTDEKTSSGLLYKPATVDEKLVVGTVVAVGSGHLLENGTVIPLEVVVGDKVVFNKQMALEIKENGESFFRIKEEQVLGVK